MLPVFAYSYNPPYPDSPIDFTCAKKAKLVKFNCAGISTANSNYSVESFEAEISMLVSVVILRAEDRTAVTFRWQAVTH